MGVLAPWFGHARFSAGTPKILVANLKLINKSNLNFFTILKDEKHKNGEGKPKISHCEANKPNSLL